jgi:hypothetical protein
MSNIFTGFLFIFWDFHINLENFTIGLIPDFVGYIFLVKGITEMTSESTLFTKVRSASIGMGIYTGILYALDLFGMETQLGWLGVLLGVVSSIISLYISYTIVCGIQAIESFRAIDLNGNNLRSIWTYMVLIQIATYVALFIPVLAFILVIISVIITIIFLINFNTSKNLYHNLVT